MSEKKNQNFTIETYFKRKRSDETDEDVSEDKQERNRKWLREHFAEKNSEFPEFYDLLDTLNARQLWALSRLTLGSNLFITGCAGTGKTLWMRAAIALMQGLKKNVAVAATTALAASNINVLPIDKVPEFASRKTPSQTGAAKKARIENMRPTTVNDSEDSLFVYESGKKSKRRPFDITPRTIHSWAGVGIDDFDPEELSKTIMTNQSTFYVKTRKRWQYTDVLFMDEVSMLSPKFFVALDIMGRRIRMDQRPFGGIQIIIVADFFQLPPVVKERNLVADTQQTQRQEELKTQQQEEDRAALEQLYDDDDDDDDALDSDEEAILENEEAAAKEYARQQERRKRDDERAKTIAITKQKQREILLAPVEPGEARCCFQTLVWKNSIKHAVVLNQIFRQNNPIFIDLLAELRRGVVSSENIERLEARTRYRLTTDLMQIAQQVFGNRNCDYLRAMSSKLFQTMRNSSDTQRTLFEQCEIDVDDNFSATAKNSLIENPIVVKANWNRMLMHIKQCAAQADFDPETALIYYLPSDYVPTSHQIIVSEIEPTNIMTLNAQVDLCNSRRLAAIKSPMVTFSAGISIDIDMENKRFQEAQEYFGQEFTKNLTPMHLQLKIGAQVLLSANLAPKFYNGRRGIVVDFLKLDEFITKYGADGLLLPKAQSPNESFPVVMFGNGVFARIGRHNWERKRSFGFNQKPVTAILSQFPLMLAFAITIHKSQGMTIERLSVNLSSAFESGLPYVALSRGINLESIVIENIDRTMFDGTNQKLLPPPFVIAFYEKLEDDMLLIKPVN